MKELCVKIGIVNYIDFDQYDGLDEEIHLLKRLSFEHERELRAVVEDKSLYHG